MGYVDPDEMERVRQTAVQQKLNRATHHNIRKIGEGELLLCDDCKGGEIELWQESCEDRQARMKK